MKLLANIGLTYVGLAVIAATAFAGDGHHNDGTITSVNNTQSQSQTLISGLPGSSIGQPSYYSDERVVVGTDGNGHNVFVVKPTIKDLAPGVESIDGVIKVDGHQSTCDNQQRAGLPKCFTIGG